MPRNSFLNSLSRQTFSVFPTVGGRAGKTCSQNIEKNLCYIIGCVHLNKKFE